MVKLKMDAEFPKLSQNWVKLDK